MAALCLSACATTKRPAPEPLPPEIVTAPPASPEPVGPPDETPDPESLPVPVPKPEPVPQPTPLPEPLPTSMPKPVGAFAALPHWQDTDPTPALQAFQKSCNVWKSRPDDKWLDPKLPKFGRYRDWRPSCQAASGLHPTRANAVQFFQSHFEPVDIGDDTGLLTGYYAPEIPVRRLASLEFSEPILALPKDPKKQNLPRKDITVTTSKVLAYGRPVDVFFMQVQGSGQMRFEDGTMYRAAFAGHNNHPYVSIGRALLKRGELFKDKAGKQDIEAWMAQAGYMRTKQLMAENPRYIFFKTENIVPGEGPMGSAGIRLTDMGSLAVQPNHYPYGALIWLEGKFPTGAGDYTGIDAGHLVVAQDMGGAIKGNKRGDVFFGSGKAAGEKAGVMKHQAKWTLFLPVTLALKPSSTS